MSTVTAETITDEQIEHLRASVSGLAVAPHVSALCDLALGATEDSRIVIARRPGQQKKARRACAKLLKEWRQP